MKRFACLLVACAGMVLATAENARADWGHLHYGGYQPWWNIFAKRQRCMSAEEERLQRFWHDYYDALKRYYGALDNIDWVSYYKNHGYQINNGGMGGCGVVLFADRIPIAEAVRQMSGAALEHALSDGEDFELAFAVEPGAGEKLMATQPIQGITLAHVGVFVEEKALFLDEFGMRRRIEPRGYSHPF